LRAQEINNSCKFSEEENISMAIFSLIEENICVVPDSRQGLFWVALFIQALDQPYELSQNVPFCPEPKMVLTSH